MTAFRNSIIHGDCLTVLPRVATHSVDFILTDPPYITRYKSRDGRIVPNDDNTRWLKPTTHLWTRSAQPWVSIPPDGANCDVQPPNFGNIIEAWKRHCEM